MNALKLGVNDDATPEARAAREVVIRKTLAYVHTLSFILVNLLLFVINLSTKYEYAWHLWPLVCWGSGLALHLTYVYIVNTGTPEEEKKMIIHSALFTIVSWMLIFIDYFTSPSDEVFTWFWWPVGIWAVLLALHYVIYSSVLKNKDGNKTWLQSQIDAELARGAK